MALKDLPVGSKYSFITFSDVIATNKGIQDGYYKSVDCGAKNDLAIKG